MDNALAPVIPHSIRRSVEFLLNTRAQDLRRTDSLTQMTEYSNSRTDGFLKRSFLFFRVECPNNLQTDQRWLFLKLNQSINGKIYNVFVEWEGNSRFESVARENDLSRPYVCGVSKHYENSTKKIMIIGQETYKFPLYNDEWGTLDIQKWGVRYLEKQLWNEGDCKYNRSAFWNMFRYVEQKLGFCPCWNNVDKAHRIIDGKTVPLTYEIEKRLNSTLLADGRTILLNEISIAKPDAILFITGPYYDGSMAAALQVEESTMSKRRPNVQKLCVDITDIVGIDIPVLWTYHPGYLQRSKKFALAKGEIARLLS